MKQLPGSEQECGIDGRLGFLLLDMARRRSPPSPLPSSTTSTMRPRLSPWPTIPFHLPTRQFSVLPYSDSHRRDLQPATSSSRKSCSFRTACPRAAGAFPPPRPGSRPQPLTAFSPRAQCRRVQPARGGPARHPRAERPAAARPPRLRPRGALLVPSFSGPSFYPISPPIITHARATGFCDTQDREDSAKYGAAAISGRAGYMGPGAFAGRGGFGGGFGGRGGFGGAAAGFGGPVGGGSGRHLYVQGVSRVL